MLLISGKQKSAIPHVSDLCLKKGHRNQLALARKNLCMLNAANLVKKTGCQMGILRILYAGLGNT